MLVFKFSSIDSGVITVSERVWPPTSSIPTSISASRFSVRRGTRQTDASLRTREVVDILDLCGRGAQGSLRRTNRRERALRPRQFRATPGTGFMGKSWRGRRTIPKHGPGGGTSLTLIYARGCDSALTAVRGQAPLSLPCRNLAHSMLAAIYKHDFKPATADAIAIGVACTPPLPGRFIGPLSYLWRTVVVFSESWVIFLSTRVSLG